MEVSGKIKVIFAEYQVSASFKKREIVITTEEQYPQHILIEFNQDKCDLLNNFHIGQPVTIAYNLRGREWINPQGEAKYFNQIQGWRITTPVNQAPVTPEASNQNYNVTPIGNDDDQDDLPF